MDSTKLAEKKGDKMGRAPITVVDAGPSRKFIYRDPRVTEGSLFVAIGSGLAVVGLVDLALLWFPMQMGTAAWEFATISRTFTNAPMTMVGLVLIAVGLLRRGIRPIVIRRAAFVFAALSFVLVAMGMLFGLAVPAVLSQASGDAASEALKRVILKNGIEIVVYPTVLLLIAVILWHAVREDKCE